MSHAVAPAPHPHAPSLHVPHVPAWLIVLVVAAVVVAAVTVLVVANRPVTTIGTEAGPTSATAAHSAAVPMPETMAQRRAITEAQARHQPITQGSAVQAYRFNHVPGTMLAPQAVTAGAASAAAVRLQGDQGRKGPHEAYWRD